MILFEEKKEYKVVVFLVNGLISGINLYLIDVNVKCLIKWTVFFLVDKGLKDANLLNSSYRVGSRFFFST